MSIATKSASALDLHVHRFVPATAPGRPPLLLLHGTGGDETDLIGLGQALSPGSALLSPRGNVLEGRAPRFFRRLAEGVLDQDDVRRRAGDLAAFVGAAREEYGIAAPVALGFSNGANIAAALLQLHPGVLAGAVLLRAMVPLTDRPAPVQTLGRTPVLIVAGDADPIMPQGDPEKLATILVTAGADVTLRTVTAGHGLVQADLALAAAFLARLS
ncbi:alpha/beta hydrolase [Rhodoplanes sp. TEM]|uniref:Alpha/beta hydrolase n=1 Tax=Rhodoplanes tepidamans TaxID=200616 RepID=A0ABT5J369_RHOTP|nr:MULTISPECIES: alpha/beta hydrolase [Rhodoplanes]MDC7784122.1 alpha/beta hydrolase [Rhodoplanes tepidamans]MDC7983217.1 alpha/beta hydrolase [Rhodoplanes sp. TEM]MDQ0356781.1 phospholipase/carboxylesterase [Rhodoplanes tepidamans]